MFIASNMWNALNISQIRLFETENEAWEYLHEINVIGGLKPQLVRVYEVFNDKSPRLCKYVEGK